MQVYISAVSVRGNEGPFPVAHIPLDAISGTEGTRRRPRESRASTSHPKERTFYVRTIQKIVEISERHIFLFSLRSVERKEHSGKVRRYRETRTTIYCYTAILFVTRTYYLCRIIGRMLVYSRRISVLRSPLLDATT